MHRNEQKMPLPKKGKLYYFKNVSIFLVLLLCLAGFIWICQGEIEKFLQGITAVNTDYNIDKDTFPNILFCATNAFKKGAKWHPGNKNDYDQDAILVDIPLKGKLHQAIKLTFL